MAGAGAFLTAIVLLGLVVLYTDVGVPDSRYDYSSLPEPCELLHQPTVRTLAGEVLLSVSVDHGPGRSRGGLTPDTAVRMCTGNPADRSQGLVFVQLYLFSTAQFHLGRTGEQQAADLVADQMERLRAEQLYPDGCVYELHDDRGTACGMHDGDRASVYIHKENVVVVIEFDRFRNSIADAGFDQSGPPMTELMATLVEEALSQLSEIP